ncbi:MAG: nitrite reductase, copper-containing [Anaerolineae bacterium]|nr:nitrite reductase, copper-containing [Anaerolineae bacterium]
MNMAAQATPAAQPTGGAAPSSPAQPNTGSGNVSLVPNVTYTLRTGLADGRMAFIGVGGQIEGKVNPTLTAKPGDTVQITLVNGDGVDHDLTMPDLKVATDHVMAKGASSATSFRVDKDGTFVYYCSVPGHRQAGMEGKVVIGQPANAPQAVQGADISRDPADVPAPIGNRAPMTHRIELETVEITGQVADGVTYTFWTFNGKVPGPFLRIMVGDTVEVRLKNRAGSKMTHSVDFHAVTGPGGGAAVTQAAPGQDLGFTFKALNPGLYVYHCATPMVAHHITNGMYGLILVEPQGGLPKVDREFYVMQGELYTHGALKAEGYQEFDVQKLLDEQPEYFIFNGATDALTKKYPLKAKVGETVRIYFGVGGPNFTSSFHVIGEIFDRVYDQASLTAAPLKDVQTTLVPAGGATMVEFKLDVPGRYVLVDHSLSRMERGLVGFLMAEGADNPDVFKADPNNPQTGSGGH